MQELQGQTYDRRWQSRQFQLCGLAGAAVRHLLNHNRLMPFDFI